MYKVRISNLKVSVKVSTCPNKLIEFKNNKANVCKDSGSFFVYRKLQFVFCIYYSGHINVTGIQTVQQIGACINIIATLPGIKQFNKITIDNITSTAKLHSSIYKWNRSFTTYLQDVANHNIFSKIQYSPQTFPGAFLKTKSEGTIVFFASGKFNVVGCKSAHSLITLIARFTSLIRQIAIQHDT